MKQSPLIRYIRCSMFFVIVEHCYTFNTFVSKYALNWHYDIILLISYSKLLDDLNQPGSQATRICQN